MEYGHLYSQSAPSIPTVFPRRRLSKFFRRRQKTLGKSSKTSALASVKRLQFTIYNITRGESLVYNRSRGFFQEEINWKLICLMRKGWKADDCIWAIDDERTEYKCSYDLIGLNPVFHLLKSFMRENVLSEHVKIKNKGYEKFYFNDSPIEDTGDKWYLVKDPKTGEVIEIL